MSTGNPNEHLEKASETLEECRRILERSKAALNEHQERIEILKNELATAGEGPTPGGTEGRVT